MKQLYLILVFVCLGCNAQTPVLSLFDDEYGSVNGAYYKDIYNDLDNYVGTWKYTNGTTSLTIVLQKKLQQRVSESNGTYYDMDFVVGGYKYVENGIEKINTMPQLLQNIEYIYDYNIVGSFIAGPHSYLCLDCNPDDRVLFLQFSDPDTFIDGYEPQMLFKRNDSGGVQKLELDFRTISGGWEEDGVTPQYTQYTVPFGNYTLIKQ